MEKGSCGVLGQIGLGLAIMTGAMMLTVAGCGGDSNGNGTVSAPKPPPLRSSCSPSSSISALLKGKNVVSYVPKGSWEDSKATGVSLVQVEGSGIASKVISTPSAANSCASNSVTGKTVCVADNTDVYLISGTKLTTLSSAGSGTITFSGGSCTNCGVAMDAVSDKALISLSTSKGAGFQLLDLKSKPTFEAAFASPSGNISEDPVVDPVHNLILSPTEASDYELIDITTSTSPAFFENKGTAAEFDSAAEDCSTGIALATDEFTSNVFITDLTQAVKTPGTPGTWTAPSQLQNLPEFIALDAGTNGIAVAQGSHVGIVTGEFGGATFGAIQLPSSSGSGTPAIADWVACPVPNDPKGNAWTQGDDPHPVTAYLSPNTGDPMAIMANGRGAPATFLAVVDLAKMLNTTVVPRIAGTHNCALGTNLQTLGVLKFVPVP